MSLALLPLLLLLLSFSTRSPFSSASHLPVPQFRLLHRATVNRVDSEGYAIFTRQNNASSAAASRGASTDVHPRQLRSAANSPPSEVMAAALATAERWQKNALLKGDNTGAKQAVTGHQSSLQQKKIKYHGGYLMVAPIPVFVIFYGTWSTKQKTLVVKFINSLGSNATTPSGASPSLVKWWKITTQYKQFDGQRVTRKIWVQKTTVDKYSKGDYLMNDLSDVFKVVARQITSGKFPLRKDAIYLMLTSADVYLGGEESGFCGMQGYCGWHSAVAVTKPAMNIKYAFVGNGEKQCGSGCVRSLQLRSSPNGDLGVDGMMSVIAHELSETATNPLLNAGWFDDDGQENADKCALSFGIGRQVKFSKNYAYNVVGQDKSKWLVQTNWTPLGQQGCVMEG